MSQEKPKDLVPAFHDKYGKGMFEAKYGKILDRDAKFIDPIAPHLMHINRHAAGVKDMDRERDIIDIATVDEGLKEGLKELADKMINVFGVSSIDELTLEMRHKVHQKMAQLEKEYRRVNKGLEKAKEEKIRIEKTLADKFGPNVLRDPKTQTLVNKITMREVIDRRDLDAHYGLTTNMRSAMSLEPGDTQYDDMVEILRRIALPLTLEKPQGSSAHHFGDYMGDHYPGGGWGRAINRSTSFVIEHNWAAAFEGVKDFGDGGEIILPYGETCFEFRVNGLRMLCFCEQRESGIEVLISIGYNKRWYLDPMKFVFRDGRFDRGEPLREGLETTWSQDAGDVRRLYQFLAEQCRAVCIVLDAGVADKPLTRASEKLAKRRHVDGLTPLKAYHVVSLAKRSSGGHAQGDGTGVKKRLHFRRGHHRHYKDGSSGQEKYIDNEGFPRSKTWIHWMLVGDINLGFVDKHYKL